MQVAGGTEFSATPYIASLAITAVALGCGLVLHRFLDVENIGIVFLMGVLTSALWYGLAQGIFTSVVSALAFNFFFLPPLYTLTLGSAESVITFVFFLIVAGIASNLTARVRGQAVAARQRARMTEDLYLFSKKLAGTATLDDVLWATAFQIASMLKVRVVLLLPENGTHRGEGRISAGGYARSGGHRSREVGLAKRPASRPRGRYAARRQAPVPAHADRARPDRCRRH